MQKQKEIAMSIVRMTNETWVSISAYSGDLVFAPTTDWIPCTGLDKIRATIKLRNRSGAQLQVKVGYQTASIRTNNPEGAVAVGSFLTTTTEMCTGDVDIQGATSPRTFVRFGVMANLASGSTPEHAEASVQVAYLLVGHLVGSTSQQVTAPDNASIQVLPIGGWLSALDAKKVKGTYVVSGADENFRHRLAYQTAETSVESPDSWSYAEDSDTWFTGITERCTGEKQPNATGKMFIRFGMQYQTATGSNKPAFVAAAVYVRG